MPSIIVGSLDLLNTRDRFVSGLQNSWRSVRSQLSSIGAGLQSAATSISSPSNLSSSITFLDNDGVEQTNNNHNVHNNDSAASSNVNSPQRTSRSQRPARSHRRLTSCDNGRSRYHFHRNGLISIRTLQENKDRNILAAILSIVVIAVLATALAQPRWFSIYNDLCFSKYYGGVGVNNDGKTYAAHDSSQDSQEDSPNSSSPFLSFDLQQQAPSQFTQYRPHHQILTAGGSSSSGHSRHFHSPGSSYPQVSYTFSPVTIYGLTPDYRNCATPQILALKRTIIGLCFLAIMVTLVQFFMDTMGTRRRWVNSLRAYAVGNVLCVLLSVLIIGLCYFISILYERVQLHQLLIQARQHQSDQRHNSNAHSNSPSPQHSNSILIHYHHDPTASLLSSNNDGGTSSVINDDYMMMRKMSLIALAQSSQFLDYLTIHQIEVKFELSYYLVTLAGFLSIIAAAANLFRRPRQMFFERISELNNNNNSYPYHFPYGHFYPNSLCRSSRSVRRNLNGGDENSLLQADTFWNDQTSQFLPPYPPPPQTWLFNPNWSIFYNQPPSSPQQQQATTSPDSVIQPSQTIAYNPQVRATPASNTATSSSNPIVVQPSLPCPPPPPYTP